MTAGIKMLTFGCLAFGLAVSVSVSEDMDIVSRSRTLREQGQFKEAEAVLKSALDTSGTAGKRIALETDLLRRIRLDFSLTREALFADLDKAVRDLKRAEFDRWIAEGRFESRMIDGTVFYSGTSVNNLFFRHPELNGRRIKPRDVAHYALLLETARRIKAAAAKEKKPYVLPHCYKVTMTVSAKADAAPAGKTLRAWLPIPREYPFQTAGKIVKSDPPAISVAPPDSPIRSVYLEAEAVAGRPAVFEIVYTYSTHGIRFNPVPSAVQPFDPADPAVRQYTREAPHVVFTDKIKALSREIAGKETNPLLKARAFYDWIGKNIQYSYALEYSTLTNISDYCLSRRYGDCGQQALLFITLCRQQGIPARWQSGWFISPANKTMHDWTEIYIPPYGWMPVDVEVGGAMLQQAVTLTPAERREAHDFYFGGLDFYRLIANSDHSQPLDPPMNTFRSDDVDFQRGELEWDARNLYFDQYNYSLKPEPMTGEQ